MVGSSLIHPDRAVQLLTTNSCINTTSTTDISAPQTFTIIAWFRTPNGYASGGKMLGFERPRTGVSAPTAGAYDRHLYMDGQGRVWFGVYNGAHVGLSSGTGLNNNQWHMAVGTQSSAGYAALYRRGASRHQHQHRRRDAKWMVAGRLRQPGRMG